MTKYFADSGGSYLGAFDGVGALATVLAGAIEVAEPPEHGADMWDGTKWVVGDRPGFVPPDLEIAIELLKAADPDAFAAKRQQIIDARRAALNGG